MTRASRAATRTTATTRTSPAKPAPSAKSAKTPATSRTWVPERGDVIWIDCNPQVGREMRDMHPMLVLSPKAFNARTSIVIGLPMTSSLSNQNNPFALDVSRNGSIGGRESSFVLCHQPKSFDWRHRRASPHPWQRLPNAQLAAACEGLNDIVSLTAS